MGEMFQKGQPAVGDNKNEYRCGGVSSQFTITRVNIKGYQFLIHCNNMNTCRMKKPPTILRSDDGQHYRVVSVIYLTTHEGVREENAYLANKRVLLVRDGGGMLHDDER